MIDLPLWVWIVGVYLVSLPAVRFAVGQDSSLCDGIRRVDTFAVALFLNLVLFAPLILLAVAGDRVLWVFRKPLNGVWRAVTWLLVPNTEV